MTEPTVQDTIEQLANLAMEAELAEPIDWDAIGADPKEAFMLMAANVIEQMEAVPEDQRAVIAMATMTKLLVENFASNAKLKKMQANG
jgi:hypothetical protein|tara:strand:- start:193 stop:456 length:264 start_codon:yes stop_codon:yes gene_type:complete